MLVFLFGGRSTEELTLKSDEGSLFTISYASSSALTDLGACAVVGSKSTVFAASAFV